MEYKNKLKQHPNNPQNTPLPCPPLAQPVLLLTALRVLMGGHKCGRAWGGTLRGGSSA